MRLCQLRHQPSEITDRPLQKLGKERYKECVLKGILLRFGLLPVDIQQISGRLKGIKRDSQRKKDLKSGWRQRKQPADIIRDKAGVFYNAKHAKIADQSRSENQFLYICRSIFLLQPADPQCRQPGHAYGIQKKQEVTGISRQIVQTAEKQQNDPFHPGRHQIIRKNGCQSEQKKSI